MMKKLLTLALGVVAMLTACQKAETGLSPQKSNEVTFNLAVDNGMATRSDDDDPTRYILGIYIDGNHAKDIYQATPSFTVTLKEGVDYTMIFFADYGNLNGEGNDYDASNLLQIEVEDGKQPTKPCFIATEEFTYDPEAALKPYLNPTLKHAVSQVNFVQGAEDFIEGGNTLTVTFPNTYAYQVTVDKAWDLGKTTTYTFENIAADNSGNIIATGYIFAGNAAQTVMDGVTIQFNKETAKTIDNVPFQMNYKTNIKGLYNNLYKSTFTVESEDTWGADIDKETAESRTISGFVEYFEGPVCVNTTIEFGTISKLGEFTTDSDGNFEFELPEDVDVGVQLHFFDRFGNPGSLDITSIPMSDVTITLFSDPS